MGSMLSMQPPVPAQPTPPPAPPKSWAALASKNGVQVDNTIPKQAVAAGPRTVAENGTSEGAGLLGGGESSGRCMPRGLINRRNECFVNATLQAMVACEPLAEAISQCNSTASTDSVVNGMQLFLNSYAAKAAHGGKNRPAILPVPALDLLAKWRPESRGAQEDAQEWLTWLLEALHEESSEKEDTTKKEPSPEEDEWLEVGKKNKAQTVSSTVQLNTSAISAVVGGTLRSVVKRSGRGESVSRQPFFCLPLDVAGSGVHSVEDALEGFVAKEALDQDIAKSVTLENAPEVLILHMKRFVQKGSTVEKVAKHVRFGAQLSLERRHGGAGSYELSAVIAHHGKKVQSGHYTCDAWVPQPSGGGWWARCDDEKVTRVKEQDVLSQPAYVLLYQRV